MRLLLHRSTGQRHAAALGHAERNGPRERPAELTVRPVQRRIVGLHLVNKAHDGRLRIGRRQDRVHHGRIRVGGARRGRSAATAAAAMVHLGRGHPIERCVGVDQLDGTICLTVGGRTVFRDSKTKNTNNRKIIGGEGVHSLLLRELDQHGLRMDAGNLQHRAVRGAHVLHARIGHIARQSVHVDRLQGDTPLDVWGRRRLLRVDAAAAAGGRDCRLAIGFFLVRVVGTVEDCCTVWEHFEFHDDMLGYRDIESAFVCRREETAFAHNIKCVDRKFADLSEISGNFKSSLCVVLFIHIRFVVLRVNITTQFAFV